MFSVPIVFIIFKRYDTSKAVFEQIRRIRPQRLFVIADGARPEKDGEAEKVTLTRSIIDGVDWDCELVKVFAEQNMGCTDRIVSGLNFVFSQVDRAIILEDDCLPDQTFFPYCEELLERYKDDERIMMVSGQNKILKPFAIETSYYFTHSVEIWGWATWARAWKKADMQMTCWPELRRTNALKTLWLKNSEAYHWSRLFDKQYEKEMNVWDGRWCYSVAKESGFSIAPARPLVKNIGILSEDATHGAKESPYADISCVPMEFPLRHPRYVMALPHLMELERKARAKEQDRIPYPFNKWAVAVRAWLRKLAGRKK